MPNVPPEVIHADAADATCCDECGDVVVVGTTRCRRCAAVVVSRSATSRYRRPDWRRAVLRLQRRRMRTVMRRLEVADVSEYFGRGRER